MSFMNLPISNQYIDAGSLVVLGIILIGILYRWRSGVFHHFSHWRIFSDAKTASEVASSFFTILVREVFVFRVLATCNKLKRASHLLIFWGFVFLAISTTLAFFTNPTNLVLPLYNPVKIFGNAGGALIIVGFLGMFSVRYREGTAILSLTRSDAFLVTLFLAVVTGFLTQQTIYSELGSYWISGAFWIHMAFVVGLLATAPFTKFFHALTKPVSLLYEKIDEKSGVEPLIPSQEKAASSVDSSKNVSKVVE
jgi:nitrate reductase gamma subunit